MSSTKLLRVVFAICSETAPRIYGGEILHTDACHTSVTHGLGLTLIVGIVEGPMSSRKNFMLIFGNWLDCVLEGIILQKKYVAIFYNHPFYFSVKFKLWSKLG